MLQLAQTLALLAVAAAGLASAGAESVSVSIKRSDCARLVSYVAAPDVAYEPGKDVYGRDVEPADLDGGISVALPDVFAFDLVIRPIDREVFDETTMPLGRIVVRSDGRAYFNGQPLQNEEQAELAARCQRAMRSE